MPGINEVHKIIEKISLYYKKKKAAEASHELVYDSISDSMEPVYFWIVDLMNDMNLQPEKIIDNFTSSPGSGHFAELGQRATIMQQQGTKILADINTVLRSVLNIIYDLREFKIRLRSYEDLKSGDEKKKEAAILSLKQIWLDKVDMQKGNSSITLMARQIGFQTLFDAFYVAKDEKDADKIDLNDRVKRIVKQRIHEFNTWVKESEGELRKRYELEKNYLRSQVNSLKLYSRWVKPYLHAAQQLEQRGQGTNPDLVKTFNTILLELVLLGKQEIKPPEEFGEMKTRRKYYSCVLIDFYFRGIPRKFTQRGDYTFGGRTEVTFNGYALNEDEIEKLKKELDNSDIADVLKLIEGSTGESLEKLQEEINFFLEEKEEEKEKKKDDSNPFLAIIGHYEKKENKAEEKSNKEEKIKPDNWFEENHLRKDAASAAKEKAFDMFDIYKKAHGMNSFT
jgi:hypothetical protein